MMTTVRPCKCKNEAQDKIYGPGMRLHNSGASFGRCTVCLDKKNGGGWKKEKDTK